MTDANPTPTAVPEFLVVLGLRLPVTLDDVNHAYRDKVKTAHPDHGGDPQQFIQLQRAYEQASEYARFKAGRMKWLSGCVEQYAEQEQLVADLKGLGGTIEVESVDWLAQSIGNDFAQVLDRIVTIRLAGPRIDDAVLGQLTDGRRSMAALHRLGLVNTSITQDGLVQLKALESLRELDLSGTKVELATVEFLLTRLVQLQELVLHESGLGSLARMKLKLSNRKLKITF